MFYDQNSMILNDLSWFVVIQYAYDANQWLSVLTLIMGILVDEWVCGL